MTKSGIKWLASGNIMYKMADIITRPGAHFVHFIFLFFLLWSGLHCRGLVLQTGGTTSKYYQTHIKDVVDRSNNCTQTSKG